MMPAHTPSTVPAACFMQPLMRLPACGLRWLLGCSSIHQAHPLIHSSTHHGRNHSHPHHRDAVCGVACKLGLLIAAAVLDAAGREGQDRSGQVRAGQGRARGGREDQWPLLLEVHPTGK